MQYCVDTAVILAAGMGTRLRELGQIKPKGFLRIGAKPIIEESIERLVRTGIKRIIIVTGHHAEFYDALREDYPGLIETIHNKLYSCSGSMYTLYQIRDYVEGGFLLLESDLIYEQSALQAVQSFRKDNVVLLSGPTNSGDEVYVETNSGLLRAMSKDRNALGKEISGELVGISKISRQLFEIMGFKAHEMFQSTLYVDYEIDGLVAASKEYPVYCHVVQDLLWAEIDDEQHLTRARTLIYPKIVEEL
ncbi:MAG TPA: phosphocholine cytidylyltransferase family protein [Gammaproteobacteria bacterium]|nr:phosphocholine cytidylyltransferase family protein [Gammaproteobacteria bacterium]